MNLLISAAGRRVNLVRWFKLNLEQRGHRVIVKERDKYAPACYEAEKYYIVKENNIRDIINICKSEMISHVITLIDPETLYFANYEDEFQKNDITLIMPDKSLILACYDKQMFYDTFRFMINIPKTRIIKKRKGSASNGLITQPYIKGKEYNVQCYFDMVSGELINTFMQEKILMRAGETERSISIWDDEIYKEIVKLKDKGFKGVLDIDVIKSKKVYIIDINTRFGGGYPLAHRCGVDFVEYVCENMTGKANEIEKPDYDYGVVMMKYNGIMIKGNI